MYFLIFAGRFEECVFLAPCLFGSESTGRLSRELQNLLKSLGPPRLFNKFCSSLVTLFEVYKKGSEFQKLVRFIPQQSSSALATAKKTCAKMHVHKSASENWKVFDQRLYHTRFVHV